MLLETQRSVFMTDPWYPKRWCCRIWSMECDRYLPDAAYILQRLVLSYQKGFWATRQRQDSTAERLYLLVLVRQHTYTLAVKPHAGDLLEKERIF